MSSRGKLVVILAALLTAAMAAMVWACLPPWIIIHRPGEGDTVSGTTSIELTVTSETQVAGVDIYLDEALLTTIAAEPYKYEWDTTKVANGPHKIYAKAHAVDRADGVSATITLTVKNAEVAPAKG